MDKERLDKILNILKSEEVSKKRRDFALKYKISENFVYPCFNSFFGNYIRSNIDIKDFVNGVVNSNLVYDLNFSIEDIILEYLRIHLDPISELLDEKIEITFNKVREFFIELNSISFGAKNVTEELSDGKFDPFSEPGYIIDEVINILDIKFSGKENRERFYDVIIKFIKNIRNKFQTFDILIKNKKDGGIGISELLADKVLGIVSQVKEEKENFLLTSKMEEKMITMNKQISKDNIKDKVKEIYKDEIKNRENVIKEYNDGGQNYHIFEGSIEEMYLNQIKNKGELEDTNIGGKYHKDYSKVKLIGPIEELALFSLKDFRNLSSDIKVRINIIERKIKVLELYSTRKKVLGVKAWLGSEVCNIYKDMVDESVKYGGMARVINMRKERGDLYLTEEEVEAISELNRKLRI